jgi:hypothetical protein
MGRKRNQGNGRFDASLEALKLAQTQMLQALANLAQNMTAITARMAESDAEVAELRRRANQIQAEIAETNRENAQRFARIEAILADLPKAVHREFGFQPPRPPTAPE